MSGGLPQLVPEESPTPGVMSSGLIKLDKPASLSGMLISQLAIPFTHYFLSLHYRHRIIDATV